MKMKEIRELQGEEIQHKLQELKEELFNLRFRTGSEKLDNPLRIRITRRVIARINTVLRQKKTENVKKD